MNNRLVYAAEAARIAGVNTDQIKDACRLNKLAYVRETTGNKMILVRVDRVLEAVADGRIRKKRAPA